MLEKGTLVDFKVKSLRWDNLTITPVLIKQARRKCPNKLYYRTKTKLNKAMNMCFGAYCANQ